MEHHLRESLFLTSEPHTICHQLRMIMPILSRIDPNMGLNMFLPFCHVIFPSNSSSVGPGSNMDPQDHGSPLGTEAGGRGGIGASPSCDDLQCPWDVAQHPTWGKHQGLSEGKMCRKSHGESWEAMGSHGKSWKWGDCHWVDVKNEGPSANSRLAVAMGQFTMVPWWTWMFVNYGTVWLSDVSMKNPLCLFIWQSSYNHISSVNGQFSIANSQRVYILGFHKSPSVEYRLACVGIFTAINGLINSRTAKKHITYCTYIVIYIYTHLCID